MSITCCYMGRLGNQLFQIASTIGIATDNNIPYKFKEWSYQEYFQKKLPVFNPDFTSAPERVEEREMFRYHKYKLCNYKDYYTYGYFQSYKYFREHSLDYFEPTEMILTTLESYRPYLEDSCALHVRRTDYLETNNFLELTRSYYIKALKSLELSDDTNIFVFSDDIPFCKEWLSKSLKNYKNVIFVENSDLYESDEQSVRELILMSMCKNIIIANSTFSWWAAYLNKRNSKIVSPKNWFSNIDVYDLLPEHWIKINNRKWPKKVYKLVHHKYTEEHKTSIRKRMRKLSSISYQKS